MKVIDLFLALIQFTWINQAYFRGPSGGITFENSKSYCQLQGTTLATIETEDDFDDAVIACGETHCWIGLQDNQNGDAEGVWSWSDGTDITTSYGFNEDRRATTGQGPWNSGQPDNLGDQDCVEIWPYNDVPCGDNAYPLCNDKYFRGPNRLSFANAVTYCEDNGAKIASIPTEADYNLAVEAADGNNVWIGLQDEINGDNDMIWSWTDGTSIASNYGFYCDRTATTGEVPWSGGEPDNYLENEDCVKMYGTNGKYNDQSCGESNYPLCKVSPSFEYFRGPNTLSFADAVTYCKDNGGQIASIPTDADYNLAAAAAVGYNVWIGLQDEINGDNDMTWSWTDGTSIASNYGFNCDRSATTGSGPWNLNEPNEYRGREEDCVVMQINGKYNDESCSGSLYPLCKAT